MANFIVNKNDNGAPYFEHEVHDLSKSCGHLPNIENRVSLGEHYGCRSALQTAEQKGYRPADGCKYCCEMCHKH